MDDPDDSFDDDVGDGLVLAYIEQEQTPIKTEQVAVSSQRHDSVRSPTAKRDRKRSQSDDLSDGDGRSVRSMKPRVEAAVTVRWMMPHRSCLALDGFSRSRIPG